ncbi:RidA family protein [Enterococcus sp. AZ103]|uniref:RidA family protein n=1 Tax=Enterococcus sp. AZ103 TaxID=2774628 RepID=UPI003F26748A
MKRKNISGNSPWENVVGYSRAVKIGNTIEIAGTTAVKHGKTIGVGDPYVQTKSILESIEKLLISEGSKMEDVVRTRMFVTNIADWEKIAKAHGEFFKDIKPASTMVEVSSLIDKELLIEIEVSAIIK